MDSVRRAGREDDYRSLPPDRRELPREARATVLDRIKGIKVYERARAVAIHNVVVNLRTTETRVPVVNASSTLFDDTVADEMDVEAAERRASRRGPLRRVRADGWRPGARLTRAQKALFARLERPGFKYAGTQRAPLAPISTPAGLDDPGVGS